MADIIDSDGFRANVGIILLRGSGEVFLGRQVGGRGWQFPQGGLQGDESVEQAAYRELQEEIGLEAAEVEVIGKTSHWLRYRLPAKYLRRNRLPMCIGQKQRWFLFALRSRHARFNFARTRDPEFDHFRWANYWEPAREVIYFKRAVYVRALTELAPLAFPGGPPPQPEWWAELATQAEEPPVTAPARSAQAD